MDMEKYFPSGVPDEIAAMLCLTGSPMTLEEIWALMDLAWAQTNAHPDDAESMKRFYCHPVWTLNGIFTESHEESVHNRVVFADAIARYMPKRIAGYGGGFGSLARLLARRLPDASIEIIEPYPSHLARELCAPYETISFVDEPSGEYDIVIAIDVLEHVSSPLDLVYLLAKHVPVDGLMFFANCFYPVIRCHLQETFYLRHYFDFLMRKMGLMPRENILYGTLYTRIGNLHSPDSLRSWILLAKICYELRQIASQLKRSVKNNVSHLREFVRP